MNVIECGIVNEYLQYMRAVRRVSDNTYDAYNNDMFQFVNYCNNHGIEPEKAESCQVQSFIADLSAEKRAPSSVNRALSSVRGFYRWMVRLEKRVDNPCGNLKNVRTPQTLPSVLWEKEMASFAQLPDTAGILWPERDKALIMLMYSAGLRISEIVSLTMGNLLDNGECARVIGKGGKERYVFFSEEGRAALDEYLPQREIKIKQAGIHGAAMNGALIISQNGRPISVPGVRWIIYEYARRSGIEKNIHPHSLRHTFATHLVNKGCDVRVVQELLGHSCISTTQRYTHVNKDGLKKVYAKTHPHGAKRGKINGTKVNGGTKI